jgi:crotonobetainyl-CoA:carnitine CoA-transferase CaiB-like acyl-CoA transferase
MSSGILPSPDDPTPRGALSDVRVLDLTWGMIGAVTTMVLADNGAEVVKLERPGGDPARRAGAYRTWDRGKRSVVVDLSLRADQRLLRSLAAEADVVVDGLGRGRLDALGAGFGALAASNPAVVYCSLTGDGTGDDEQVGYDILAAARFGVMAESPGHRDGPIFPGHPAHAYSTALVAAIGILAAVRARLVTGVGDRVDVSVRDGVLALMGMNWWSERQLSFISSKSRTGRLDMGRRRLLLERYRCAGGTVLQVHTGAAGAFARAMAALGIGDEISKADGALETATELTDEDLVVLRTKVPEIFASRTADEWMRRLWDHEVACLPVQPPGQVFADEQIVHAGVMRRLDDSELGPIDMVGPVVGLSVSPGAIRGPAPRLDQDGASVRQAGWSADGLSLPATAAPSLPHPLTGVRLVEFSNWFASPSGNRLLRDLGADVVKVEAIQGDPIRPLPDPCEGANGGKRSIAIDLKNPAAIDILRRLLASADVVQHNMRPGSAERLALDESSARALNPSVVYAYGPGYGSSGPKAGLQSFAPLLSGFVGLMHIAAGDGNEPHTCFGNEDYYAGLVSAIGILLALVHRDRTGVGQCVETPQLLASVVATSEYYRRGGEIHSCLPRLDHDQTGWSAGYRLYQCLEGWICVACVDDDQLASLRATVVPGHAELSASSLGPALQEQFFRRTSEEWCKELRAVGVPTEVVREDAWLPEFLCDPANLEAGAAIEFDHPLRGRIRVIGEVTHLTNHPARRRDRSPLLGEHTLEILEELGFSITDATRWVSDGVVGDCPPAPAR